MYEVVLAAEDRRITVYGVNAGKAELIYIRGEKSFSYELEKLAGILEFLRSEIEEYYNCECNDIQYTYFGNIIEAEQKVFENCEDTDKNAVHMKPFHYEQYMLKVFSALESQGKLISDHGVNLSGRMYYKSDKKIFRKPNDYDLLGYSIGFNEFMNCMQ